MRSTGVVLEWMPVVKLHAQLSAWKQQGLVDLFVRKVVCGVDELESLH